MKLIGNEEKEKYTFSFLQSILIIFFSFELSRPLDFIIVAPSKKLLMSCVPASFLSFCFWGFFSLGIVSSTFAFGRRRNIGINRNNWCLSERTTTVIRGFHIEISSTNLIYRCINFLLKPLNSSCIQRRSMRSQGHPAWEGIYGNKLFLELQSVFHHDPLRTLWFSTLPLVNDQLFSLLHRKLFLKIGQTHYTLFYKNQ